LFNRGTVRRGVRTGSRPTADHACESPVKVTVLSTMLAGNPGDGVGEWGFAALLRANWGQTLNIKYCLPWVSETPRGTLSQFVQTPGMQPTACRGG